MKKLIVLFLCLLPMSMYAQDWTRVACVGKNHTVIYNQIMNGIVTPLEADLGYDDGHQFKFYVTTPSESCYEVIHTIDIVLYDEAFLYAIDQTVSFGNDMHLCMEEVRSQVEVLEYALQNVFDLPNQNNLGYNIQVGSTIICN